VNVAVRLPPETEQLGFATTFRFVVLLFVIVHDVSCGEKLFPVMVSEVPGSMPNGGEPEGGEIGRRPWVPMTLMKAVPKSPWTAVIVTV
jgi:hypothetical protein